MGKNFRAYLEARREILKLNEVLNLQEAEIRELNEKLLESQEPPIPKFLTYGVQRSYFVAKMEGLGVKAIGLDDNLILTSWYYYTTLESWGDVLEDLVFKSSLYREHRFMCFSYAIKAQNKCAERYGLNGLRACIDNRGDSAHAYCIFGYGDNTGVDGFLLFEPNDGYQWSGILEFGDYNYIPEQVLA